MKKVLFFLTLLFSTTVLLAQSEKFVKAMQDKVVAVDSVRNTGELLALSAAFERIGDAEKNQWLPYYYAALTQVNAAYMMGMENLKPEKVDPIADKAEALLAKAEANVQKNSEIFVLKKMIASLRMMGDPMNRWQTYGPQAAEALQTAKAINPDNPRVLLLEAQDKFFTPEQFGGSKAEAKKLFEEALKKYETFKPATPLDPVWGRTTAVYFLGQIK
ncbi:MAG TPA: hypothetical protein VGN63_04850 [Flavisolibacter sp.]|jgi:hypothetical protein|nr:hypothetical protein [Flavisolibacter sp.]